MPTSLTPPQNDARDKLWRHFYIVKTDVKKYSAGVLAQGEVSHSNFRQLKEILDETRPGGSRSFIMPTRTTRTTTEENNAMHDDDAYPATTFFLAKIRHQLLYMEPNTAVYRVWNPSKRMNRDLGEREGEERKSIYTSEAGNNNNAPLSLDSKKPHRVSSRRIISSMLISDLDAPGFLRTDELHNLLDHHRLVRETEVGSCHLGVSLFLSLFNAFDVTRILSILLNEMPIVVVSSNPNQLIHVMSALLSLIRPCRWQHLFIPVIPTSCATVVGGAIDPSKPFFVGCDPAALPGLVGHIKSTAVRLSLPVPGITVIRLDASSDVVDGAGSGDAGPSGAGVDWGREFGDVKEATRLMLKKMKPFSTAPIIETPCESMNPLHSGGRGSVASRALTTSSGSGKQMRTSPSSSSSRRSLVSERDSSIFAGNAGQKIAAIPLPCRYTASYFLSSSSSSSSSPSSSSSTKSSPTNKRKSFWVRGSSADTEPSRSLTEQVVLLRKSLFAMLSELMTQFPLFVEGDEKKCFDVQGYVESLMSVRPDCSSFVRMFIQTDMFDAYLRRNVIGGSEKSGGGGEQKSGGGGGSGGGGSRGGEEKKKEEEKKDSEENKNKNKRGTPFEDHFNLSIARQLNILVAETGMSINVQKVGYLHVAHMELVHDTSSLKEQDRPLKLKEQKRWIVLDRQRLTYYKARSTKRVKNTMNLNPLTTRISVSPPLPDDSSGLVVFTKPFTMKIESDESKEVLYLRSLDEITFREWHNAIQTRLMPAYMRSKMRNYSPSRR